MTDNDNLENNRDPDDIEIAVSKDFRGQICPMNFVMTKLSLEKIQSQEILEVLLDDGEPIKNVPESIKHEGHEIISITKIDDYCRLRIRKA